MMAAQDAWNDLGPSVPPRCAVYALALQVEEAARLARELTMAGPRVDVPRALKALDRARALLGSSDQG